MAKQRTLESTLENPTPQETAPEAPRSLASAMGGDGEGKPSDNLPAPQGGSLRPTVTATGTGLQLSNLDEMVRFCKIAVGSGLSPAGLDTLEKVFIALQAGLECGLSPWAAIQNCCVIKGKPSFYGPILVGLCRSKPDWVEGGFSERVEGDGMERAATVTVQRVGGQIISKTFSMGDAKRANLLGKDNWVQYPDDMLIARARGRCLKSVFSHHLHGIGIAEELEDIVYSKLIQASAEPSTGSGVEDLARKLGGKKPETPVVGNTPSTFDLLKYEIEGSVGVVDSSQLLAEIRESHRGGKLTAEEANRLQVMVEKKVRELQQ